MREYNEGRHTVSKAPDDGPVAGVAEPDWTNLHSFERHLAIKWPVTNWRNLHVLLAVSGGADSTALLRAILALKTAREGVGKVYVGHFDHGLRGDASHADAEWLRETCRRLRVPLEVGRSDVFARAAEDGDGVEAAARAARYEFLQKTAERLGARFLVTAHTASDQAETVLHRIIRGTGLAGLAGIPAERPLSNCVSLIRPMLAMDRAQVIEYLAVIRQDFREDTSNADLHHTRNCLRHEILPTIREKLNPEVDLALVRLSEQAAETQSLVADLARKLSCECAQFEFDLQKTPSGDSSAQARQVFLDCVRLACERPILIREVCRAAWREANWPQQAMGASEWQKLALLVVAGEADRFHLPGGVLAERQGTSLIMKRSDFRCLP